MSGSWKGYRGEDGLDGLEGYDIYTINTTIAIYYCISLEKNGGVLGFCEGLLYR